MRGELETEQNCNILTPTLMTITVFLSRSPGLLNCGPGGPASLGHGPHSSIFSPTDLNFLSTYFLRASQFRTQFNPSTVKVTPDLFDRIHLLFTQVHFFFWQLGWVGGQYATYMYFLIRWSIVSHCWFVFESS